MGVGMSKQSPMPDMAERLREARAKVFPSAAAAAEALGMKAGTVRAHENGQNGIGYEDLVRYARRYGVQVLWLITGGSEATPAPVYDDWEVDYFEVEGTVQDGAWYPSTEGRVYGPVPVDPMGHSEVAGYADERFPPDVIHAFKVRTDWPGSRYLDGTILFAVPGLYLEFRPGDHILVSREKSGFVEVTVREIGLIDASEPLTEENVTLKALISDGPPLSGERLSGGVEQTPFATVIGSLTKRPVPGMSIDARREYEDVMRKERRGS